MVFSRPSAPGALELLEAFCNTARFLRGEDVLADPAGARGWLHEHAGIGETTDERAHHELSRLREAIRDRLDGQPQAAETLNDFAAGLLGPPRWNNDSVVIPPTATGARKLAGTLLATLAEAEMTGQRHRLKTCRARDCRWVFYDRSPANNSVWCSMNICGARHKMRAYRTRRTSTPTPDVARNASDPQEHDFRR